MKTGCELEGSWVFLERMSPMQTGPVSPRVPSHLPVELLRKLESLQLAPSFI